MPLYQYFNSFQEQRSQVYIMESTQILETASDSSSFTSWLVQKVRGLPGQRVLFNDIMSIYNKNTDPDSQVILLLNSVGNLLSLNIHLCCNLVLQSNGYFCCWIYTLHLFDIFLLQNCSVYPLLDSTEMKWNRKYWPSGEKVTMNYLLGFVRTFHIQA